MNVIVTSWLLVKIKTISGETGYILILHFYLIFRIFHPTMLIRCYAAIRYCRVSSWQFHAFLIKKCIYTTLFFMRQQIKIPCSMCPLPAHLLRNLLLCSINEGKIFVFVTFFCWLIIFKQRATKTSRRAILYNHW